MRQPPPDSGLLVVDGGDDLVYVLVAGGAGLVGILVLLGDVADAPADGAAVEGDGFAGGHVLQLDVGPQDQVLGAVLQTKAHQDVGIEHFAILPGKDRVGLAL